MTISYMVVADPVAEVAQRIANDCSRLTENTVNTTTGEDTIKAIKLKLQQQKLSLPQL